MKLLLALIVFFGCHSRGVQPTSAQRPTTASLLSFKSQGESCLWMLYDLPAGGEWSVLRTHGCPEQVVWAQETNRVYFIEDRILRSARWGEPNSAHALVGVPFSRDVSWKNLWIDQRSGRLRLGYLIGTSPIRTGDRCRYEYQGQAFETRCEGHAEEAFVIEAGVPRPAREGEEARVLPSFGAPHLAVMLELGPGTQWRRVAISPTRYEAGDTPGFGVLAAYAHPGQSTWDLRSQKRAGTCGALREADKGCSPPPWATPSTLEKLGGVGELGDPDSVEASYMAARGESGLLFRVLYGDTPHIVAPVVACRGECVVGMPLKIAESMESEYLTLSTSADGRYVLIASERSGTGAQVFALDSRGAASSPVLSLLDHQSVIWLPAGSIPKRAGAH